MAFGERVIMQNPERGVNLGGWLVLEPWITPGLFAGLGATDEYSLCKHDPTANKLIQKHRSTFITEKDFAWLAAQGITVLRLPVGYWLFGDVSPYMGTVEYVDKAFAWAKKYGLKILLDLHGAPGSQNGEMHSGQAGEAKWGQGEHINSTLNVLDRLAKLYGKHSALWGISLLNEPSPRLGRRTLEDFYKRAYALLRPQCGQDVWLVFSDAFRPWWWYRRLSPARYPMLAIDYHHYQIFGWFDRLLPASWQLWRARHTVPLKIRRMTRHHPLIVGEWSLALPAASTDAYGSAQLRAFDPAVAWFYWTYKTTYGGPWDFRSRVEQGALTIGK